MIEQLELDQIISKRNQFGPNRYQVISESLLFEQYQLIEGAAKLIQEQIDREKKQKMDKNDRFMIFATDIVQQQSLSIFHKFSIEELEQYRLSNTKNTVITILKKLITEHIQLEIKQEPIKVQKDFKDQKEQQLLQYTIIIELEKSEINKLQKDKIDLKIKENALLLLQMKSKENLDFWENQHTLKQVYQKEILKAIKQLQFNETVIYITGKNISMNDLRAHFEQKFIITKVAEDREELCCDIVNNPTEIFIPIIIFNQIFADQIINPILELQKLTRQVNFQQVKSVLGGNQTKPIDILFKLTTLLENCKQIQRWFKLLTNYLQSESIVQNQQNKYLEEKIEKIKNYLSSCYKYTDKRFQDKFYDMGKEDAIDVFQESITQMEKDPVSNTFFSIVLYEIKETGLMLYQNYILGQEKFNVLAKLEFNTQNINSNKSSLTDQTNIEQLSLIDKEEKKLVYTMKFILKKENQYLIDKQNEKFKDLIMEVLMKCVTTKVKQQIFNPNSRENIGKPTKPWDQEI